MDYIFLITGYKYRHLNLEAYNAKSRAIENEKRYLGNDRNLPSHRERGKVESNPNSSDEEDLTSTNNTRSSDNTTSDTEDDSGEDSYQVEWESGKDPLAPENWPMWKKIYTLLVASFIAIVITANSSIFSDGGGIAAQQYHVGATVGDLCSATFLLGFAAGSVLFAPLSEVYGRLPLYSVTLVIFVVFQIGGGCSKNIWSLVIFRFFHGFFGCTPMSACGGTISDLFNPIQRTGALLVFSAAAFVGPLVGPVMGGYITESKLGWRWDFWINMIWAGLTWVIVCFTMPETHSETLLDFKARYLRKKTNCDKWYNEHEHQRDPAYAIRTALTRGVRLLCTEPIVQAFCMYLVFINILLYICMVGYPLIFYQYGFNAGEVGLAILGILVGILLGLALTPIIYVHYRRRYEMRDGNICPEDRLFPLFFGSFFIPIALFWLGWTCYPSVHWAAPMVSGIFLGWGFLYVLAVCYSYLVDCYHEMAASALSVATFTRYAAGGGMTIVARPMYNNLNYHWATSLLAFVGCGLVPIPFIFFFWGRRIRQRSPHAYKG
ncbi:Membrane transporter [Schizosaccharomyces pombe]